MDVGRELSPRSPRQLLSLGPGVWRGSCFRVNPVPRVRGTAVGGATIAFLKSDRPDGPRASDAYGERLSEYRS